MLPNDFYEANLSRAWVHINRVLFGEALLVAPTMIVVEMTHHLADWNAAKNLIRFSQSFVRSQPWLSVQEVLKHEMAHQYVSDVLGVDDETSHGPAFQMVCERYGIDGRARWHARTEREDHAIDKIRKLFRLGESPNENESRAALAKAQKLLDEYGLTALDIDPSGADEHGVVHLGNVIFQRRPEDYRTVVAVILARYFRVRCIWLWTFDSEGRWGRQLEVCGRRCDLAIAEHVHDFLHAEAGRLWTRAMAGGKRNQVDFFEGVMRGFLDTLVADEKAQGATHGPGLVRVHAHALLDDYFERRHPKTRRVRGSRRRRGAMFGDGVFAGRNISLNEPLKGGGPKLLGPAG